MIAHAIYRALGGQRFASMSGASSFHFGEGALAFKIPARTARNGAVSVIVTHEQNGTFDMLFHNSRDFVIDSEHGLELDELRGAFTEATGLPNGL